MPISRVWREGRFGSKAVSIARQASAAAKAKDIVRSGLENDPIGPEAVSWLRSVLDAQNQKNKSSRPSDNKAAVDRLFAVTGQYLNVEKDVCLIPKHLEGGALVHYQIVAPGTEAFYVGH